ncbi:MAG: hypothetical protein J6386_20115 [Candidatus Synoicihabitans palmerolidicus]|nr:hypothetical protein [Candidatus Synoicihabitans palmerolidicus]
MPSPRLLVLLSPVVLIISTLLADDDAPARARVSTPAPVRDYAVSFFSEEGYPWARIQGRTADLTNRTAVILGDMSLTVFSGTADRVIEGTLTSPIAIVEAEKERVSGPESVRLVNIDLELTGEDWSYDRAERRIHIRRQARLVFNTELSAFLK